MGKARNIKWLVALLVVAALAVGVWQWWPQATPEAQIKGQPFQVKQGTIRRLVVSTGTVKPQVGAEVKVGARVSGRVEKLLVSIGQEVKAGQVVAVLEHEDLQAKLNQAGAELNATKAKLVRIQTTGPREVARAQAELTEAKATADLANLSFKRQEKMRSTDLVAQDALDQARERRAVAEARLTAAKAKAIQVKHGFEQDLKVAQAELNAAKARVVTAQVSLDYATVRAPIDGVVSSVSTQEGETVAASLSSPTFINIVDLSRLQVDDFVDETDIGKVKVGQFAFFTVDAYPHRKFMGKVESVQPSAKIVDDVVYYPVTIKIMGEYQGLLKPEMTATVSIISGVRKDVPLVPLKAVRRKKGATLVYLQQDGQVKPTPVKLGWSENVMVQVMEGLQPGQTVILPKGTAMPSAPKSKH
ncbi:MAG: efflux RND transporter periplasmic adaptor subunit [Desulfarculaceae bacterium]|nr:efflux RND transporter periplasmic adaptor subunit [Desulfarculaceae bacterium]